VKRTECLPASDMLVQRLNESIAKAVEESQARSETSGILIVDESTDKLAMEVEEEEKKCVKQWVEAHCLVDGDGRARCSFHFCRKLFKDKKFLHKHLVKKHPEYLHAEQAKIHDKYMMNSWEEETVRPIPQAIVDCGQHHGYVPVCVVGAAEPIAPDPEPQLHAKAEERRLRLEEERRAYDEEQRLAFEESQRHNQNDRGRDDDNDDGGEDEDAGGADNRPARFVDVDDMKEEKVQLDFENLDIPPPPKKKKKKKKKLA